MERQSQERTWNAAGFVINGYSREYLEKHSVDWLKTHVTGIAQSADMRSCWTLSRIATRMIL